MFGPLLKLKSFDHTLETAENLFHELKFQFNESLTAGDFSLGLVMVLRVAQHLSLPPDNQFVLGAKVELKYDYMLLKLFSLGLYPLLLKILEVCSCVF